MIQASRNSKYIKMKCVESIEFKDKVWGDCSLIEGEYYNVLNELTDETSQFFGYYMVNFGGGNGLCPHGKKHLKTDAEIRAEKLNSLGI